MAYYPDNIKIYNSSDIVLLDELINNCIMEYCNKYNIDIMDAATRSKLNHMEAANIIRYINNSILSMPLEYRYNNGYINSLIDYDDNDLIIYLINKYLAICNFFNKSLGIYSLSVFLGVDNETINSWLYDHNGEKLNDGRALAVQKVQQYKARSLVNILQNSGIGALAVANNDKETGLNWAENAAPKLERETVYFLPSERMDRLKLDKSRDNIVNDV